MDNFYIQQVTHPTRGTAVLDLVITSQSDMVHELKVLEGLALVTIVCYYVPASSVRERR